MPRRPDVDPRFGSRMRILREERGRSLRSLERPTLSSKSKLHKIETGVTAPTAETARLIDEALQAQGELLAMVRYGSSTAFPRREFLGVAAGATAASAVESLSGGRWVDDAAPAPPKVLGTGPFRDGSWAPLPQLSSVEVEEILAYLREQWHALVRCDNLLGPSRALVGVRDQLVLLRELMQVVQGEIRLEVIRLAAQYAESAAWLYEDAGELALGQMWTDQAMEWSYESNDAVMLAWTNYRRSQQATVAGHPLRAIELARAARRQEEGLAEPMRAATRVQEARGYAMSGDPDVCLKLLDDAHSWSADDSAGEARGGHGSFCTESYIEINRAECLVRLGRPQAALGCYEEALPGLPAVYRRDRASALAGKAAALLATGEPELAAASALAALPIAHRAGSRRIIGQIATVATQLAPHRQLPPVAALLDDLAQVA